MCVIIYFIYIYKLKYIYCIETKFLRLFSLRILYIKQLTVDLQLLHEQFAHESCTRASDEFALIGRRRARGIIDREMKAWRAAIVISVVKNTLKSGEGERVNDGSSRNERVLFRGFAMIYGRGKDPLDSTISIKITNRLRDWIMLVHSCNISFEEWFNFVENIPTLWVCSVHDISEVISRSSFNYWKCKITHITQWNEVRIFLN